MKTTLPVTGSLRPAFEVTTALMVMACPTCAGFAEKLSSVVVPAALTREFVVADAAASWSESPSTIALSVYPPGRSAVLRSTETVAAWLVMSIDCVAMSASVLSRISTVRGPSALDATVRSKLSASPQAVLESESVACTLVVADSRSTSTSVSEPRKPSSGTNSKRREVVPLCSDEVGMTMDSSKSALPTSSVAPAYTLTLPLMTVP